MQILNKTNRHIAPITANGPMRNDSEIGSISGTANAPRNVRELSAIHPMVYLNERSCFLERNRTNTNAVIASAIISII
jgi:glutamine amidotransferase-like uncharacterized protein